MSGRRRRLSTGSVLMLVASAAVLCCAFATMLSIRGGAGTLTMDAERLAGSVSALLNGEQTENLPDITVQVVITPQPARETQQTAVTAAPSGAEAQPSAAQPPAQETRRTLTLTVGGEYVPDSKLRSGIRDRSSGTELPELLFAGVSDALYADVNIILGEASGAAAQADGWWARALQSAGFDWVIPTAEKGLSANLDTAAQQLKEQGVAPVGEQTDGQPAIYTINGVRIAVLSCREDSRGESAADAWLPAYGKSWMQAAIRQARAQGAQLVLVCVHWKKGTATEPTAQQKTVAQELCDAGADVILGVRSGAVWPVNYLQNSATGKQTLVAWSLGTLLSSDRTDRAAVSGVLLHMTVSVGAADDVTVESVAYTPCYTWGQDESGIYRYRVLQSAKEAPAGMITRQSEIMARALKLIQDTMAQGVAIQR